MAQPPPSSPSPSPSPAPQAPTALTPGPRASRLLTIHTQALDKTLSSIPYTSFQTCFPTIATHAPTTLQSMHTQIMEALSRSASREFERTLEVRNVVAGLNALEDLIADAEKRRKRSRAEGEGNGEGEEGGGKREKERMPFPPHLLPAGTIVAAHLEPVWNSQQSQLNARIQTRQGENARLMEEIRAQREEIEGLLRAVEDVVGDLGEAGGLLSAEMDGDGQGRSGKGMEAEGVLGIKM